MALRFAATQKPRTLVQAPGSSKAPRMPVVVRSKSGKGAEYDRATGFVAEDNSGRANIFPTTQKAYLNSSTADEAARQGLGGLQGGLLVGFAIGAVALVTFLSAEAPGPETLQTVSATFDGDSLAAIAARIQATL